jgi:hypothetical protein
VRDTEVRATLSGNIKLRLSPSTPSATVPGIGSISRGSSYSSSQDKPKGRKEDFSRIIVLKDGIFLS